MYSYDLSEITAPAASGLVSVNNLRTALAIESTDAGLIAELQLTVDAASAVVSRYCDRQFAEREVVERFRGGGYTLALRQLPVVGNITIEDKDGNSLTFVQGASGMVWREDMDVFPAGEITITYKGGYVLPTQLGAVANLPRDVELACQDLAKWFYLRRGRDPQIETESLSGISAAGYAVPMALPEDVTRLLEPYVAHRLS